MPKPNITGVVSPSDLDMDVKPVPGEEPEERESDVEVELTVALSIGSNGILIPIDDIVQVRDSLHDIAVRLGIAP